VGMTYTVEKFSLPNNLHEWLIHDYETNFLGPGKRYPKNYSDQYKKRYNCHYDCHYYTFDSEKDYMLFLLKWS